MTQYDIHSDDPLEMIWAVREQINEETQDMNWDEFNEYVRQRSEYGRCVIESHRKKPAESHD